MSTIASALLETKFQFPFAHPDSSFLGMFLAKPTLSLSGQLSTPWVQLNFSTPKNKKGEETIALLSLIGTESRFCLRLKSTGNGEKAAAVRVNNKKRMKGFRLYSGRVVFRYACLTHAGRTGTGIKENHPKRIGIAGKAECDRFPHAIQLGLFFLL